MPIYEYQCRSCGYEFEEVQKFSDPSLDDCPSCGVNSAERIVSISSFHLKGGGWYKDGYSTKKSETEKSEDNEKAKKSSNEEVSKSESSVSGKKESKTEKNESISNKKSSSSSKEKAA